MEIERNKDGSYSVFRKMRHPRFGKSRGHIQKPVMFVGEVVDGENADEVLKAVNINRAQSAFVRARLMESV